MYIILKEENHPDCILEHCIGPFPTYEEAEEKAKELYYDSSNYNQTYQHRIHTFKVAYLISPENAY